MMKLVKILKALANDKRLQIMELLEKEPMTVEQLSRKIRLSFRSTSKHLQRLGIVGLVEREQRKQYAFYKLGVLKARDLKFLNKFQ